jgi:hypothetical protein
MQHNTQLTPPNNMNIEASLNKTTTRDGLPVGGLEK